MTASNFEEELEEAVEAFEEVLKDYGVISRAEAMEMIEKAKEEEGLQDVDTHEAREREAETAAQAAEETFSVTVEQLREALPSDIWTIVSRHLAAAEDPLPDTDMVGMEPDVEKAVNSALTTSGETLTKVRGELAVASEPSQSYEETEKAVSTSDVLLSRFYDGSMEPRPVRKSKEAKKDTPEGLTAIEDAKEDL